ncbi:MAG: hypothetical protein IJH78_09560 [Clostridia bacterium]|nr:hypothetical protein [Clostridia bacterium]
MAAERRFTSDTVRTPTPRRRRMNSDILGIILAVALPPVGLCYLWRIGALNTRGRAVMSGIATVEMTLLIALFLPGIFSSASQVVAPVPGSAALITPAPESDVATALSNMEQLLRIQEAEQTGGDVTIAAMTDQELAEASEALLNSTVYGVYSREARYYHSKTVCGRQSNLRTMTLREALQEGLGPCPDCNPPTYSELGNAISGDITGTDG